ncbi:Asp-tRNA(Asn)/Glu-tRNA(Gln) amidotransferase GatCAB subunit A [Candidatus Pacearchaeota archaeon]|nr:Asp-tRNA(Asn)/Glu-tRNA(Gln) amidotransferase GatCAB subunit A [Candidatus Pacearchaeota archaeon]
MGKEELIEEKVKGYLSRIKAEDKKVNAFLELNGDVLKEARKVDSKKKKGKLFGLVFGVKSNINVLGLKASCASETLKDYKSTYDATVIKKIKEEDGIIIGMLNCDEFASGVSGENSAFGATDNSAAPGRITGGSSSGSAAAVAAGFCDLSLGSDTGGSIRTPASHCGVIGVKPSYGAVSRYGLIDLSMSLDQIGVLGKNVEDCANVLSVIAGKEDRDTSTRDFGKLKMENYGKKKIKIGVLRLRGTDSKIQKVIDSKVKEIVEKLGWNVGEIEIENIELAVETYYPLVYVEFFSGTRRFDGRKYGKKIEDVSGKEVLRRILGGSEISKAEFAGQYYRKALGVKNLISLEFEKAFKKFDCVVSPVTPVLPWKIGQGEKMSLEEIYAADALTCPSNLAGICAISVPAGFVKEGKEEIPVGIQVMCGKGEDGKLLGIAREIEGLSR